MSYDEDTITEFYENALSDLRKVESQFEDFAVDYQPYRFDIKDEMTTLHDDIRDNLQGLLWYVRTFANGKAKQISDL